MLDVKDVDVFYRKAQALWKVSFRVNKGETVAIVGPNGAGKTTILNTISGLLHPSSGYIEFLGKRIDRLPPHNIVRQGLSHVPEGRKIFPRLTVLENLKIGAYLSKERWEENLEQVYGLFPKLKERSEQRAGTLSGGERQMLALGRGLMSDPKLLMLDEPSMGLAPALVLRVFESVTELGRRGITILLVEQHVHRTLEIADRAYVIENGRIVLNGTGSELLRDERIRKSYLGI